VVIVLGGWHAELRGAETVRHPFLGVTHITRTETSPRNVTMHIVRIDLTIPGIGFKLTPPGGRWGGFRIALRAERRGKGSPKIYTITASARDRADNVGTATATCVVAHDRRKRHDHRHADGHDAFDARGAR
jgi:hypothetical protein